MNVITTAVNLRAVHVVRSSKYIGLTQFVTYLSECNALIYKNRYVSLFHLSIALRVTEIYLTFDLTVALLGTNPLIHLTMVSLLRAVVYKYKHYLITLI